MSTPRQRGLVDSLYAVERAADALGNSEITALVAELGRDVRGMWFPTFSAPLYMQRTETLANAITVYTGTNPLDVDDATPWAGVETPARAAFSSGELGATLSAVGEDVSASAGEAAAAAKAALFPVGIAVCVLVGVYFFARGVSA